jgi:hypothetical protein
VRRGGVEAATGEGGAGLGLIARGGGDVRKEEESERRKMERRAGAYISPPHLYRGINRGTSAPVQILTFVPDLLLPRYKCSFHFAP